MFTLFRMKFRINTKTFITKQQAATETNKTKYYWTANVDIITCKNVDRYVGKHPYDKAWANILTWIISKFSCQIQKKTIPSDRDAVPFFSKSKIQQYLLAYTLMCHAPMLRSDNLPDCEASFVVRQIWVGQVHFALTKQYQHFAYYIYERCVELRKTVLGYFRKSYNKSIHVKELNPCWSVPD